MDLSHAVGTWPSTRDPLMGPMCLHLPEHDSTTLELIYVVEKNGSCAMPKDLVITSDRRAKLCPARHISCTLKQAEK